MRCFSVNTSKKVSFRKSSSGQALIESAILIPLLLAIVFNAINFGYFYYVALNMSAATRSGALYSILGANTPVNTATTFSGPYAPAGTTSTTGSVSYIMYQDMAGALASAATTASIQVCSQSVGQPTGTPQTAPCTNFGPATFTGGAASDPEAPDFVLHQVDVKYTFKPLIPGTPFGAILLATPACTSSGTITCTFHRKVLMRAM